MPSLSHPYDKSWEVHARLPRPLRAAGFALLLVLGFATALLVEFANKLEAEGLRYIASKGLPEAFAFLTIGLFAFVLLVRYPEIALALFFLVGLVKGDPSLASAPVDLTLLIGAIVLIGVCYRLVVKRQVLRLPQEYVLYLPLLLMMVLSLTYTPDFAGGMDKLLRFVCLTSIGIIAPFVLFDDLLKLGRFFFWLLIGGLALAINSLTMLGGEERMVSPSGLNTELGAASAVALILIWGMVFPRLSLGRRILLYPFMGILGIALIGSGGRFANVSTVICLIIGAALCQKLFTDIFIVGGLGAVALPLFWIPQASFDYLRSLLHPSEAMGTRNDLMWLGVRMFSEHPIFGVGIQGFRYLSPNPLTYNYPHNLFLELGSEMGIFAAVAFLALAFCAFREVFKQMRDPLLPANSLVPTVLLLLIYVFLDAMVSGDINDLRFMWFVFGLPYVLRNVASTMPVVSLEHVSTVRRVVSSAGRTATQGSS